MFDTPTDSLDDIFGTLAQQVQDVRIKVAMANQQYSDVKNDVWTPGNIVARWNAMTPVSQQNAVAVLALITFVVWKIVK